MENMFKEDQVLKFQKEIWKLFWKGSQEMIRKLLQKSLSKAHIL
jgi:acetylglutamate synthase